MPLVRNRTGARDRAVPRLDAAAPDERRAAVLLRVGQDDATEELLSALPIEPSAEVREAIMTALAATGSSGAAAGLAEQLGSEDAGLRNSAIDALRRIGAAAREPVAALLGSTDVDRRLFAVNVLDAFNTPWARALLRDVLDNETDVNVGLAAVEAVGVIGTTAEVPALDAFARRHTDEPMVRFAVDLVRGHLMPGARS